MTGILQSLLGSVSSANAVVTDAYFNLVTLLLPGNGTNGAQNNTFLDSSTNNFTITRNGNTTQGTFSPFSQTGWSNYFASSSGFRFADSADFSMGTNAFTIECFVYLTKTQSAGSGFISQWIDANDSNSSWQIGVDWNGGSGGNKFSGQLSIGGTVTAINDTNNYALNTWHHVALCRSGSPGTVALFVDGVRVASTSLTGSIVDATNPVGIGVRGGSDSYYMDGVYISNARVVNGTDVYGATNTSITVPTSPLTAVTNTKLLTCQSNRFLDTNTQVTAKAVSQVLGTPSVQAFSPFAPTAAYSAATNGGSGYFDGSGDYLSTGSVLSVGTSTMTFETWAYFNTTDNYQTFISGRFRLVAFSGNTTTISTDNFGLGGGSNFTVPSLKTGQWYHIAYVKNGTTGRLYVNGVESTTGAVTDNNDYGSSISYTIGSTGTQYYVNGYMAGTRLVIGSAVYTGAFTPPTSPPTAITNTSLLLNFTNGGIIDATSKNVLETVGNAQISTTQSKFGGSSISVDGTGDWLVMPSNPGLNLGSGAYTIEFWYRPNEVSNDVSLIAKWGSEWLVQYLPSAGPAFRFAINTSTISDFTSTLSTNTWYHIAICRDSSGNLRMFKDGTQIGSTITSGSGAANNITATTNPLYIGTRDAGTQSVNGYFDDIRITKGYARYTANFTPPTAAFALQ